MPSNLHIDRLTHEGLIPEDSVVISERDNLIVSSMLEQTVSRISTIHAINRREGSGDIIYSHELSYGIGRRGAVVSPVSHVPDYYKKYVISTYPLLRPFYPELVKAETLSDSIQQFNAFSIDDIAPAVLVKTMNIPHYAGTRIARAAHTLECDEYEHTINAVMCTLDYYNDSFNFRQLIKEDPSIVHGNMHAGNVVTEENGKPLFIDLDSAAIGPRLYDIASWRVRQLRGEPAPTDEIVTESVRSKDASRLRSLIGWNILYSMTQALRYSAPDKIHDDLRKLADIAQQLEAPGDWTKHIHECR